MTGASLPDLGARPAVVVIDMQNAFCEEQGFVGQLGLDYLACRRPIEPISRLLEAARGAGIPVFHAMHTLNPDYSDAGVMLELFPRIREVGGLARGSWDAEIIKELQPGPGEPVIDKPRQSVFWGTDFAEQLSGLGVDTLIVTGVTTNVCVGSTVRDAFSRDLRTVVASDGTAATTPEMHAGALRDFIYAYGQVATVDEIAAALAVMPAAAGAPAGARG